MIRRFAPLALAALLGGCATIVSGASQPVTVTSDPPGGQVLINGRPSGVAPLDLSISRKNPPNISVHLPGCGGAATAPLDRRTNGWLWANLVLYGVGMPVDFITGAVHAYPSVTGARCVNGRPVRWTDVVVGMAEYQLVSAWGEPRSRNSTITDGRASTQWVYGNGRYVYVDDGVVTAIQATTR